MTVVFSPDAKSDLGDIFDYIAQQSPARAESFVDGLLQAALAIADFPVAWPLIPRYESSGYRRRSHKGYLIFFHHSENELRVLRILNGMQDYERLLFPEE
jgi:toxin ParE1/3/4